MGLFSGPSSNILQKIALGYVSAVMEYRLIANISGLSIEERKKLLIKAGLPEHIELLAPMVVEEVSRLGMGWLKRNQFLGMVQGHAVSLGLSGSDANHLIDPAR